MKIFFKLIIFFLSGGLLHAQSDIPSDPYETITYNNGKPIEIEPGDDEGEFEKVLAIDVKTKEFVSVGLLFNCYFDLYSSQEIMIEHILGCPEGCGLDGGGIEIIDLSTNKLIKPSFKEWWREGSDTYTTFNPIKLPIGSYLLRSYDGGDDFYVRMNIYSRPSDYEEKETEDPKPEIDTDHVFSSNLGIVDNGYKTLSLEHQNGTNFFATTFRLIKDKTVRISYLLENYSDANIGHFKLINKETGEVIYPEFSENNGEKDVSVYALPPGFYYSTAIMNNNDVPNYVEASYIIEVMDAEIEIELKEDSDLSSGNTNYFSTKTYLDNKASQYLEERTYYDGLGRPKQKVQMSYTPNKADLVSHINYDQFGREFRNWLPVSISNNNEKYTPQNIVTSQLTTLYGNDTRPYMQEKLELSPLNRTVESLAPGEDWFLKKRTNKAEYRTNEDVWHQFLDCRKYIVIEQNGNPSLPLNNNKYSASSLYVTKTIDENQAISYEFKDKLGQVILTRQINDGINHDTYYVYDDFENLCFVLPPRIQEEGISQTKLDELAYQYRYDYRNRCIWKKLPGCEPIYYVYDQADQLIFTQDGELRGKREWLFSIPDVFGRAALTGICSDTISVSNKVIKAEYPSDGSGIYQGYHIKADNESITFSPYKKLLTANYYDNYNFLGKNGFPNQTYDNSKESALFGKRYDEGKGYEAKGQLTGTITALFGNSFIGDSLVYSTMYYDNRSRLIQSHSSNHLGGKEIEYLAYNFTGQPIKTLHVHTDKKQKSTSEEYAYTYDHAGRLVETEHKINDLPWMTLSKNKYDELGRLESKIVGGNEGANINP